MARRDNHLAARALADWARHRFARSQETAIAATYQVGIRTLWRWKDALNDDPELAALYKTAVEEFVRRDWADELDETIRVTVDRLRTLIESSYDLQAVTEAFAKLSEVAIAKEMLHGALNGEQVDGATSVHSTDRRHPSTLGPN